MNSTARRRARMTARMKSPRVFAASPVTMPTTLSSGGNASAPVISTRYLSLFFDHSGSVTGSDVDLPEFERGDHRTEPAGLHQFGVLGLEPRFRQHENVERLACRARIGVADLLAFEILDRLDRRILLHQPCELGDREHVVADDLDVGTALDRDRDRARIGFAVGDPGHRVAHRRAAAAGGDDAGHVGALLLEIPFGQGDAERHAVRR